MDQVSAHHETFVPECELLLDAPIKMCDGLDDAWSGNIRGIEPPVSNLVRVLQGETDSIMQFKDESGSKSVSEAETIVLPLNERSLSKPRKQIKLEDSSGDDDMTGAPRIRIIDRTVQNYIKFSESHENKQKVIPLGKRKRPKNRHTFDHSSAINSVVISQDVKTQSSRQDDAIFSDPEISRSPLHRHRSFLMGQGKAKSVDRSIPEKSTAHSSGQSHDTNRESLCLRKQLNTNLDVISERRNDLSSNVGTNITLSSKLPRSLSPSLPSAKPNLSTRLFSKSGDRLSQKKKRVPAPLQPVEFNDSDDCLTSSNSRPQSVRIQNTASLTTRESSAFSARLPPQKKHVNASGQTPLAVACARGKLELVKKQYEERPEDINVPDNALNTPLHIASLEGWTSIVKFLLATGNCKLDCINTVKDTPLHDAIDNKNFEVVRLLLNAGANPCKPNQAGNDPLDLVNHLGDSGDKQRAGHIVEMKEAVASARKKYVTEGPKKSEQSHHVCNDRNFLSSSTKDISCQVLSVSNNDSSSLGSSNRKVGTARSSMRTTERVLYQTFDLDALRVAARDGDIATVSRVLDVKPGLTDAQTLYNAAKGGHDAVISVLFALGDFDPDPKPVIGVPAEYSTPILAAIGKDHHLEVIKLFFGNSRFNPKRQIRGEKYFEIARRRSGPKWKEEVEILTKAYQAYEMPQRPTLEVLRSSESIRDRASSDLDLKKAHDEDERISRLKRDTFAGLKPRNMSMSKTPRQELDSISHFQGVDTQNKVIQRDKTNVGLSGEPQGIEVISLAALKQESHKNKFKLQNSSPLEIEAAIKPRRKLVSGKELRDERDLERKRRASAASTTSGISGILTMKKKDGCRANTSSGQATGSSSPKNKHGLKEPDLTQNQRELIKDRHISKIRRAKTIEINSFEDRRSAVLGERPDRRRLRSETSPGSMVSEFIPTEDNFEGTIKKKRKIRDDSSSRKLDPESPSPENIASSKSILSREIGIQRSVSVSGAESNEFRKLKPSIRHGSKGKYSREKSISTDNGPNIKPSSKVVPSMKKHINTKKEETVYQSLSNRTSRKFDESKLGQKEEIIVKHQPAEGENQCLDSQDESANLKKLLREPSPSDKLEGEDFILEEKNQVKKILSGENEGWIRLEQEQQDVRLSKLPVLLKWFVKTPEPKTAEIAKLFSCIVGYRYDTINTEATGQKCGEDQWMLNTHAAILLGEKDLQLSQHATWERAVLTNPQKRGVWNTCNGIFLLLDGNLQILRHKISNESQPMHEVIESNKKRFLDLDLFFVKVTEFMCVVPRFPHLKDIEMVVVYRELRIPQNADNLEPTLNESKWPKLPLRSPSHTLVPLPKHFVNGMFIHQTTGSTTRFLKYPPPPDSYPRRLGLTRVYPGDPDYERTSKNQKLREENARNKPTNKSPADLHFLDSSRITITNNGLISPEDRDGDLESGL